MDAIAPLAVAGSVTLAAGGYLYAGMWPTSQIFGSTVVAPAPGEVALTYDDGPSPQNTPALLDLLSSYQVKATFFLMGDHVRRHPHLAQRIAQEGHAIGNHTMSHPKLMLCSANRIRQELETCQQIVQDIIGVTPTIFRPPFGSRRPVVLRIAKAMGVKPVLWNVTAKDWEPIGIQRIFANVQKGMQKNARANRGSNILLHDASHLDGVTQISRADSISVTRMLLQQSHRFVTFS